MPSLDEIHESIEARLGQLRAEITSLQAARSALRDGNARTTRTSRAPTRAVTTRPRSGTTASSVPDRSKGGQAATEAAASTL